MANIGLENGAYNLSEQAATPSTPEAGYAKIYVKTDKLAYMLDSSGNETQL